MWNIQLLWQTKVIEESGESEGNFEVRSISIAMVCFMFLSPTHK